MEPQLILDNDDSFSINERLKLVCDYFQKTDEIIINMKKWYESLPKLIENASNIAENFKSFLIKYKDWLKTKTYIDPNSNDNKTNKDYLNNLIASFNNFHEYIQILLNTDTYNEIKTLNEDLNMEINKLNKSFTILLSERSLLSSNLGIKTFFDINNSDIQSRSSFFNDNKSSISQSEASNLPFDFNEEDDIQKYFDNYYFMITIIKKKFSKDKKNIKAEEENIEKYLTNRLKKKDIFFNHTNKEKFIAKYIFKSKLFNSTSSEEFSDITKSDLYTKRDLLKELIKELNIKESYFDSKGNNSGEIWSFKEKRGNEEYDPPFGWFGWGLNVLGIYENDLWLDCNNNEGEWCVAYHGVGAGQTNDAMKLIIKSILINGLKPGKGQALKDSEDKRHKGRKVGEGVYCMTNITDAEEYAGIIELKGNKYKVALMLRVNPNKIRQPSEKKSYWVLNGNNDEIRPYRLLLKKIN